MNNEKLMEILAKLGKRLDLVTMGILALLLGVVAYLVLVSEQGFTLPIVETPPPQVITDQVETEGFRSKLLALYPPTVTPLGESQELRVLVQNDMFNLKAMKAAEEARKALNVEYKRAEGLFVGGKLAEAAAIIEGILAKDASHPEARDLKKRIETARNPTPSPSPTPG